MARTSLSSTSMTQVFQVAIPSEAAGYGLLNPSRARGGAPWLSGTAGRLQGAAHPEDFLNTKVCKQVNGDTWLKVHAWVTKSGELKKWQSGIAHTLAGCAAAGWDRGPSLKQARHGVVILEAAQRAGVIADSVASQ